MELNTWIFLCVRKRECIIERESEQETRGRVGGE